MADFAKNSDKVDGFHAVGAGASVDARSGKLVATNETTGRLPNNIIAKAPDANLLDGADASAFATAADLAALQDQVDALGGLQTEVDALTDRVAALESKLAHVSYDDANKLVTFEGVNVRVVNGLGNTYGNENGLGNLIVGYNRDVNEPNDRGGSHNLIVGDLHTYPSSGALIAGFDNTASALKSSVTGGESNVASGIGAVVSGGTNNESAGENAAVSGGSFGIASGNAASLTGGAHNTVIGDSASITGGRFNLTRALYSDITGGQNNTIELLGIGAAIGGGDGGTLDRQNQWLGGTVTQHVASVSIDATGQTSGNGSYDTRAVSASCSPGEMLLGGGGAWSVDNNTEELPLIGSQPTSGGDGWRVRGGNDTNAVRTLTVFALCLMP